MPMCRRDMVEKLVNKIFFPLVENGRRIRNTWSRWIRNSAQSSSAQPTGSGSQAVRPTLYTGLPRRTVLVQKSSRAYY